MGYVETYERVEEIFPEAITIASPNQIKQDGVYLLFEGSKALNITQDEISFSLAIAANSYTKENGVMSKVDALRKTAVEAFSNNEIRWKEVKALSFEGSTLFLVVCSFTFKIDT